MRDLTAKYRVTNYPWIKSYLPNGFAPAITGLSAFGAMARSLSRLSAGASDGGLCMRLLSPTKEEQNWTLARNVIIYDELNKAIESFNRAEIKAVVLSGAALAATVYPNISYRPMSDIDILAAQDGLTAIEKQLAGCGYQLEISRDNESHYQKKIHNFTLHIDVHNSLPYSGQDGLDDIMSRACQVKLSGVDIFVLDPEDALIYAGFDAVAGHARITRTVLSDIALIIRNQEITAGKFNWPDLIKRIKQYRVEAPLYFVLSEVSRREYVAIPADIFKAIKPAGKKAWELMIYRYFIKHRSNNDDIAPVLRALTRPGKAGLLRESFLPAAGFMQRRYNVSTAVLYGYYPIRFFSHIWRVSKLSFGLLRAILF
ncbi:MAG: nucleotidyltransferase family protein [Planctomycetota bacterium]